MSMHLRRMKSMQAFNYIETVKDDIRKQSGEIYSRERFYSNTYNGVLMVYLPNKEYYKNVLKAFKDQIKECKGPWSTKHVDMLIDRDTDVAVRSKPYWGKYNIKVNARPNYNIRWDQRTAETEKLSLFFKDNTNFSIPEFPYLGTILSCLPISGKTILDADNIPIANGSFCCCFNTLYVCN